MSDIDYNSGAPPAIGFGVSFLCALAQMSLKRRINASGVYDSNGVLFSFFMPSLFAAIFSAIAQGINNTATTFTPTDGNAQISYNSMTDSGRG